jgi:hypothetical protein
VPVGYGFPADRIAAPVDFLDDPAIRRHELHDALRRRDRLESQAGHAVEDPVVGHERHAETQGGGGDPAIGGVFLLGKGMASGLAVGAELRVDSDQVGACMDDFRRAAASPPALASVPIPNLAAAPRSEPRQLSGTKRRPACP